MAVSGINIPTWRSSTLVREIDRNQTGKPFVCTFSGLLFDMDGTIVDSTNAIVKHWERVGREYGADPRVILATSHGRRSIDVFQYIDPSRAKWDYIRRIESAIPLEFGADAVEIAGARHLLTTLEQANAKWAIVTSGTRPLVEGWLKILGLAEPKRLVTAEDVENGKPDPCCYRMARKKLGLEDSAPTLVLEDAPAGIRAGKEAGCKVLAVATTHEIEQLKEAGADWIVQDLRSVRLKSIDRLTGQLSVEIGGTLL